MPKKFSFPRSIRLKKYQKIQNLFQNGNRKIIYPLFFQYIPSEETKIIITISKNFGNAVQRFRVKRQIKEVVRLSTWRDLKISCAIGIIIGEKIKQQGISFNNIKNAISKFISFQKTIQ